MTTTRTGLHLLAFPPLNVGLVIRLVAGLVLVRPGGTIGAELVATRLVLDGQVTIHVLGSRKLGETRDPVTIGLRAEARQRLLRDLALLIINYMLLPIRRSGQVLEEALLHRGFTLAHGAEQRLHPRATIANGNSYILDQAILQKP
jgi:hypothetical protein